MVKRIRVTVDGVVYHAVLLENSLAEKIAGMCPFTLDCIISRAGARFPLCSEIVIPRLVKFIT